VWDGEEGWCGAIECADGRVVWLLEKVMVCAWLMVELRMTLSLVRSTIDHFHVLQRYAISAF
jgi:hypothetical protein